MGTEDGTNDGVTLDDVEVLVWRILGAKDADTVDRLLKVVQAYAESYAVHVAWPRQEGKSEAQHKLRESLIAAAESGRIGPIRKIQKRKDGMNEEWTPIPGYEGLYEISDQGRVKSLHHQKSKIMKTKKDRYGYEQVGLTRDGQRTWPVHALMLLAFVGPRPETLEVRHLNGISCDNRLVNLVYGTKKQNAQDKIDHGRSAGPPVDNGKKTHCLRGHPFDRENTRFRSDGTRACKACQKIYNGRRSGNSGRTPGSAA